MNKNKEIVKQSKKKTTQSKNQKFIQDSISKWESSISDFINFEELDSFLNPEIPMIKIIESVKGTGKTLGKIADSMKHYKTRGPSVLLRKTTEEIKEFYPAFLKKYESGDFPMYIGISGYQIIQRGIFKETSKSDQIYYKAKVNAPVILFGSINSLSKKSSVPFPDKIKDVIDDELTNPINADIDLQESKRHMLVLNNITRGNNPDNYYIFLNTNIESLYFYHLLGISDKVKKVKAGEKALFEIETKLSGKKRSFKILFYRPKRSEPQKIKYENSPLILLSAKLGMGDFFMEDEALNKRSIIPKIKKLGDFQFNLIIQGEIMGIYLKDDYTLQISRKFQKTKETYYFYFSDYSYGYQWASRDFVKNTLIPFIAGNNIECSDQVLFSILIVVIQSNQGFR